MIMRMNGSKKKCDKWSEPAVAKLSLMYVSTGHLKGHLGRARNYSLDNYNYGIICPWAPLLNSTLYVTSSRGKSSFEHNYFG